MVRIFIQLKPGLADSYKLLSKVAVQQESSFTRDVLRYILNYNPYSQVAENGQCDRPEIIGQVCKKNTCNFKAIVGNHHSVSHWEAFLGDV